MQSLTVVGRVFIASALIAFGIQHLVYADFVTRIVPKLPAWIPAHSTLAYLFGSALIAAGILFGLATKKARPVAVVLGATVLLSALLNSPQLATDVRNGALWTQTFKGFALSGAIFALAAILPKHDSWPDADSFPTRFPNDALLLVLARVFFASFLILAGVQHFIYAGFVDTLVPTWIPAARFWTYFSAAALLAGGVGLLLNKTLRLAGLLTGLMILSWALLLHIPRAFQIGNANETTAVFEAIAFAGFGFLLTRPRAAVAASANHTQLTPAEPKTLP